MRIEEARAKFRLTKVCFIFSGSNKKNSNDRNRWSKTTKTNGKPAPAEPSARLGHLTMRRRAHPFRETESEREKDFERSKSCRRKRRLAGKVFSIVVPPPLPLRPCFPLGKSKIPRIFFFLRERLRIARRRFAHIAKDPVMFPPRGLEILGCEMGLEPTTTGITIRDSTN